MAWLRLKCPFWHFNRDWRTRFGHSKWNSSTGRSTEAFSTAMSIWPKETRPLPYPFNRDCGPRNLTWSDQNPLNSTESHIELPIDNRRSNNRDQIAPPNAQTRASRFRPRCVNASTTAPSRRSKPPSNKAAARSLGRGDYAGEGADACCCATL